MTHQCNRLVIWFHANHPITGQNLIIFKSLCGDFFPEKFSINPLMGLHQQRRRQCPGGARDEYNFSHTG